jgi:hypothetical protein
MIDRFVVPVYNLSLDKEYECNGFTDDMEYNISLKTYSPSKRRSEYINEEDLKEAFKYGSKNSVKNYYEAFQDDNAFIHNYTKTLLIIDITSNIKSVKYYNLFEAIINALNLTIENGISYYKYFTFSQGYNYNKLHGLNSLHSYPAIFSPMNRKIFLDKFFSLNSLDIIIQEIYNLDLNKNQYSRIITLSLDYLKLSRRTEKIEQAFLILMIVIESMFKESESVALHKYIKYLAILLSKNDTEYNKILYKFKQSNNKQNKNEYFIGIRNAIAHGKESLESEEMKKNVIDLYSYTRRCILSIIEINSKKPLENYYNDLFKKIKILEKK